MKKQGRNRTYHATLVDEVVTHELKDIEREIKLLNAKRDSLTQLFNVMAAPKPVIVPEPVAGEAAGAVPGGLARLGPDPGRCTVTQREIVKRLDEIDLRLDSLELEIDCAERVWSSLQSYVEDDFEPRWLSATHAEQDQLIAEYRELSRRCRHQA